VARLRRECGETKEFISLRYHGLRPTFGGHVLRPRDYSTFKSQHLCPCFTPTTHAHSRLRNDLGL
jgi:hypothetical protein